MCYTTGKKLKYFLLVITSYYQSIINIKLQTLLLITYYFIKMNPVYKLCDWVDVSKLSWKYLSGNPNAVNLLEHNLDKVDWQEISGNPNAVHILEKHLDKVHWNEFSANPNAVHILVQHLDKVNWAYFSSNPNAIHILEQHMDKVDWEELQINPNAIPLLLKHSKNDNFEIGYILSQNPNSSELLKLKKYKRHIDDLDTDVFSLNPSSIPIWKKKLSEDEDFIEYINFDNIASIQTPEAMSFLEDYLDKLCDSGWDNLCENPCAIHILKDNFSEIYWTCLSRNPNAIHMLLENKDRICWENLSINPNIFTLDYQAMTQKMPIAEELVKKVMNPIRLMNICNTYDLSVPDWMMLVLQ